MPYAVEAAAVEEQRAGAAAAQPDAAVAEEAQDVVEVEELPDEAAQGLLSAAVQALPSVAV